MRLKHLTGLRFARLVVVQRATDKPKGKVRWRCKCDCGRTKIIGARHLLSGATKSCGCIRAEVSAEHLRRLPRRRTDLRGRRFGRLTVIDQIYDGRRTNCLCACDCRGRIITRSDALLSGMTRSCGCLRREQWQRCLWTNTEKKVSAIRAAWTTALREQRSQYSKELWADQAQRYYGDLTYRQLRWMLCSGMPVGLMTPEQKKEWLEVQVARKQLKNVRTWLLDLTRHRVRS